MYRIEHLAGVPSDSGINVLRAFPIGYDKLGMQYTGLHCGMGNRLIDQRVYLLYHEVAGSVG